MLYNSLKAIFFLLGITKHTSLHMSKRIVSHNPLPMNAERIQAKLFRIHRAQSSASVKKARDVERHLFQRLLNCYPSRAGVFFCPFAKSVFFTSIHCSARKI